MRRETRTSSRGRGEEDVVVVIVVLVLVPAALVAVVTAAAATAAVVVLLLLLVFVFLFSSPLAKLPTIIAFPPPHFPPTFSYLLQSHTQSRRDRRDAEDRVPRLPPAGDGEEGAQEAQHLRRRVQLQPEELLRAGPRPDHHERVRHSRVQVWKGEKGKESPIVDCLLMMRGKNPGSGTP